MAQAVAAVHHAPVEAPLDTASSALITRSQAQATRPTHRDHARLLPLAVVKLGLLASVLETAVAQSLARLKTGGLQATLDTSTSQAFTSPSAILLGQPLETATAPGVTGRKMFVLAEARQYRDEYASQSPQNGGPPRATRYRHGTARLPG